MNHSRIEIRPSTKWAVMAIAVGLVWWSVVLALGIYGWLGADWIWKSVSGLAFLGSAAMTVLIASRWKSLSLIADSETVRFGVRVFARNEVSAIGIGPKANTPTQFWLGVVVMAITQDLSAKVQFLSPDGRTLFEVSDLYGSTQLAKLASFLGVPFAGGGRLK